MLRRCNRLYVACSSYHAARGMHRAFFLNAVSKGDLGEIRLKLLQICGAMFQKFSSIKGIRKQRFWRDIDDSSLVGVVTSNALVQIPVPALAAPWSPSDVSRSEGVSQVFLPGSLPVSSAIPSITSNVLLQLPNCHGRAARFKPVASGRLCAPPCVAPPFPSSPA